MLARLKSLTSKTYYYIAYKIKGGSWLAKEHGVKIGKNCRIYIHEFGTEPFLIYIGDNVTITAGVKILTHDGATCLIENNSNHRFQKYAPVKIGSNVFIGVNSIIMPGVTIGDNVVVAAGSIVTKDVNENSVVAGNPAKKITTFQAYEEKVKTSYVSNSEIQNITDYKERVLKAVSIKNEKDQ